MDFPIQIDTLRVGMSIIYLKGSQVGISNYYIFISLKIVFTLINSADLDEMLHFAAFHLDFHCFPKQAYLGVFSLQRVNRERSGSVIECLTQDRGAVGLSLTGVTALCP